MRHDVVVLGASGLTGRLVCAHLAARAPALGLTWAAAGRDAGRVRAALESAGAGEPEVLVADTSDPASLARLAQRATVVLSLAGPYTERADPVIAACVEAGTSYADLTGETPTAARVVERWHAAAQRAGVAVVQVAGFEALPFDVATALAAQEAQRRGAVLDDVDVTSSATPPPGTRPGDLVSGGTLASLVAILREPRRPRLADPALLLPGAPGARALRRRSPLRLVPRAASGRVVAPLAPAAFINPPVVHRTAALRAAEQRREHAPFRYREGTDCGPAASPVAWLVAGGLALGQASVLIATALPAPARRGLAALLTRVLPGPGTGPSGPAQEDWRWALHLRARTAPPGEVAVRVEGRGHPGYAATARMIAELGMVMAAGPAPGRAGCTTPALALGADLDGRGAGSAAERLAAAGVRVEVAG